MRLSIFAVFALFLLAPGSASSQEATPIEGEHGAAYVSYGYTEGSSPSLDNLQFDLDLVIPGTVVSFTGHFTDQTGGVHVGPTGCISDRPDQHLRSAPVLGGIGLTKRQPAAIGNKTGGGIEVPLPKGAVLRLGLHNHQQRRRRPRRIDHRIRREVLMHTHVFGAACGPAWMGVAWYGVERPRHCWGGRKAAPNSFAGLT